VSARSLVVVSAGLSQPSSSRLLADRLAAAVAAVLPVETTVIEVRDHAHDVVNNLLTGNGGGPSGALARRIERAARELAEQMSRRESRPPHDPFDLPITFDRLLAGD
jgi:hypothetical protein